MNQIITRRLEHSDLAQSHRLGTEAYGGSRAPVPLPSEEEWSRSPVRSWGAFDGDILVARLSVYGMTSWFGGAKVPTAGIAGVAVSPEHRGRGLLRPVFAAALAEARERGEVISTLFPTAPGIYRGFGYEIVGSYDDVELPLSALARVRAPEGVTVRRAGIEDVPAIEAVHARWAAAQNGPLTRDEEPFAVPAEEWFTEYTGVTVAVEDGEITGFVSWDRGEGYDPRKAVIEVDDLDALTPGAARALWASLGSHASVVGRVHVSTSGTDPAWLVLPDLTTSVVRARPYMLSLLDVPGALGAVRCAPLTARVPFAVRGGGADEHVTGAYVLEVSDGVPVATRDTSAGADADDRPVLTARGLALSYAGAQPAANLRASGDLTGPDTYDETWTALFGGRQVHVRDYF